MRKEIFLSITSPKYLYNVAHFITMRGTVAFEILNCNDSATKPSSTASILPTSTVSSKGSSSTGSTMETQNSSSSTFHTSSHNTSQSHATGPSTSSHIGVVTVTTAASACSDAPSAHPTTPYFKRSITETNQTCIRILFNDAVYPVAHCQDGHGNSCLLGEYATFIHERNIAAGEFKDYCNVTTAMR